MYNSKDNLNLKYIPKQQVKYQHLYTLTTLGTAKEERRLSACAYNYTMEVGVVDPIRLT